MWQKKPWWKNRVVSAHNGQDTMSPSVHWGNRSLLWFGGFWRWDQMITASSDTSNLTQQVSSNPQFEEQLPSDELWPKCSSCPSTPRNVSCPQMASIQWNPSSALQNWPCGREGPYCATIAQSSRWYLVSVLILNNTSGLQLQLAAEHRCPNVEEPRTRKVSFYPFT